MGPQTADQGTSQWVWKHDAADDTDAEAAKGGLSDNLERAAVGVQELIVQAAPTGDTETIYHATALDPLTGAVCALDQIRDLVDEMPAAEAQCLP
jgi:alpha-galactosidase/6-phospho-beta-glucosidase family protein